MIINVIWDRVLGFEIGKGYYVWEKFVRVK